MDNERFKFRGKTIDSGEWVYGNLLMSELNTLDECNCYIAIPFANEAQNIVKEVHQKTVGQCTVLKDKHGKLIYEGDVCRVWGHPQLHQTFDWNALVVWQELNASFKFEKIIPTNVRWDIGVNTCEIIGDKFSNPELLNPSLKEG